MAMPVADVTSVTDAGQGQRDLKPMGGGGAARKRGGGQEPGSAKPWRGPEAHESNGTLSVRKHRRGQRTHTRCQTLKPRAELARRFEDDTRRSVDFAMKLVGRVAGEPVQERG